MSKNYKEINFKKSVFVIIMEDTKIFTIDKKKGLDYHIDYLKMLSKNNKEIKQILTGVDFDYYRSNPSAIIIDVIPLFSLANATVFINMAPNIINETNLGIMFFPEVTPKSTRKILKNMYKNLSEIDLQDFGKYNKEIGMYEIAEFSDQLKANDSRIYEFIENNNNKEITK